MKALVILLALLCAKSQACEKELYAFQSTKQKSLRHFYSDSIKLYALTLEIKALRPGLRQSQMLSLMIDQLDDLIIDALILEPQGLKEKGIYRDGLRHLDRVNYFSSGVLIEDKRMRLKRLMSDQSLFKLWERWKIGGES